MPQVTDRASTKDELARIYHQLKTGTGHELVNDGNVRTLIRMAEEYGDTTIATILREWQSPCSGDASPPPPRSGS